MYQHYEPGSKKNKKEKKKKKSIYILNIYIYIYMLYGRRIDVVLLSTEERSTVFLF